MMTHPYELGSNSPRPGLSSGLSLFRSPITSNLIISPNDLRMDPVAYFSNFILVMTPLKSSCLVVIGFQGYGFLGGGPANLQSSLALGLTRLLELGPGRLDSSSLGLLDRFILVFFYPF